MKMNKSIILSQEEIIDACAEYIEEFYDEYIPEDCECEITYDQENEEISLEFIVKEDDDEEQESEEVNYGGCPNCDTCPKCKDKREEDGDTQLNTSNTINIVCDKDVNAEDIMKAIENAFTKAKM